MCSCLSESGSVCLLFKLCCLCFVACCFVVVCSVLRVVLRVVCFMCVVLFCCVCCVVLLCVLFFLGGFVELHCRALSCIALPRPYLPCLDSPSLV